jgi:hypothetical protein
MNNDQTMISGAKTASLGKLFRLFPGVSMEKLASYQPRMVQMTGMENVCVMNESRKDRHSFMYVPYEGYLHIGFHDVKQKFHSVGHYGADSAFKGIYIPREILINPFSVSTGPLTTVLLRVPYTDEEDFLNSTKILPNLVMNQNLLIEDLLQKLERFYAGRSRKYILAVAVMTHLACEHTPRPTKELVDMLKNARTKIDDDNVEEDLFREGLRALCADFNGTKKTNGKRKMIGGYGIVHGLMTLLKQKDSATT